MSECMYVVMGCKESNATWKIVYTGMSWKL